MKDCLNCNNYEKTGHFTRDCPKQGKSGQKKSNARVYALTQGEAEVGTSKVVASQISITHTSAYTLMTLERHIRLCLQLLLRNWI